MGTPTTSSHATTLTAETEPMSYTPSGKGTSEVDFLRETCYTVLRTRMIDQDIKQYMRSRLIQLDGGYY